MLELMRISVFLLGLGITMAALSSAVQTFVLPRAARSRVTGFVFRSVRAVFDLRLRWAREYREQDQIMAFYAPISLLLLLPVWLFLVLLGFMAMFWATGIPTWREAFTVSGSSLLTLGFARGDSLLHTSLAFVEATIGLILVALLIAYLPTMYSAFSRRERSVTLLEARAGQPPSAAMMILRYARNQGLDQLHDVWDEWERWFAELEESHTSLAALVFFRSPKAEQSWVTAASAVLDAASMTLAAVDIPWDAQAALCIRSGFLALRRINEFFQAAYQADPHFPEDPISISQQEFDTVYDLLASQGVPLKSDRQRAWLDFAGWRVNYDMPLSTVSRLTMAPVAPWIVENAWPETRPRQ